MIAIPQFNNATNSYQEDLDISQKMISQVLSEEELNQLICIKVDTKLADYSKTDNRTAEQRQLDYESQLDGLDFEGKNSFILSSGATQIWGPKAIADKIHQAYFEEKENSVRYGSLLLSNCLNGLVEQSELRVLIVDDESQDPHQRQLASQYKLGDCHGRISSEIASQLKTEHNLQYRFTALPSDSGPTFLAKGTTIDKDGFDVVLPRSSIKGYAKNTGQVKVHSQENGNWKIGVKPGSFNSPDQTKTWLLNLSNYLQDNGINHSGNIDPTNPEATIIELVQPNAQQLDKFAAEYQLGIDRVATGSMRLPKAVLGNMENASIQVFQDSWQFNQFFSKEAVAQDILPLVIEEADYIANIQNDPPSLKQYIVDRHNIQSKQLDQEESDETETGITNTVIEILKSDIFGQLQNHPKVADFVRQQLQNEWKRLATKGAVDLEAATAIPGDIKKGTIIAPHLKDGEQVILTRYPIINGDNIRTFTVDNSQPGALEYLDEQGIFVIRQDQFALYQQGDHDGDKAVLIPAHRMPSIAAECLPAAKEGEQEQFRFPQVIKEAKIPYDNSDLKRTALKVRQGDVGIVANAIAKIWNQKAHPEASPHRKQKLEQSKMQQMGVAALMLQRAVDKPKSNTTIDPDFLDSVKGLKHSVIDYKNHDRAYLDAPIPLDTNPDKSSISLIADEVSKRWEQAQILSLDRSQYVSFFDSLGKPDLSTNQQTRVDEVYQRVIQEGYYNKLNAMFSLPEAEIGKAFSNLYQQLDQQITAANLSEKEETALANKVWKTQHGVNLNPHRKGCAELCQKYQPTIYSSYAKNHSFIGNLEKQPAYVVDVPFESSIFPENSKSAEHFKATLDQQNIPYEATVHSSQPMIQFAIKPDDLGAEWENFIKSFNKQENRQHNLQTDVLVQNHQCKKFTKSPSKLQIHPPKSHLKWIKRRTESQASLAFALFPHLIKDRLQSKEPITLKIVGKQYGAYKEVDLKSDERYTNKDFVFAIKPYHNQESDRYGDPAIYLADPYHNNKLLYVGIPPDNSAKLPNETVFKGSFTKDSLGIQVKGINPPRAMTNLPLSPSIKARQKMIRERNKVIRQNKQIYKQATGRQNDQKVIRVINADVPAPKKTKQLESEISQDR